LFYNSHNLGGGSCKPVPNVTPNQKIQRWFVPIVVQTLKNFLQLLSQRRNLQPIPGSNMCAYWSPEIRVQPARQWKVLTRRMQFQRYQLKAVRMNPDAGASTNPT